MSKPVTISGSAHKALAERFRRWSGWDDATLTFTDEVPIGRTNLTKHHVEINHNRLVLNPNRLVGTVTPFRLRQEALLTGVLLHEAAHARYTRWKPRTPEEAEAFTHSDGKPVSRETLALATLLEEPRIEGHMTREAGSLGAGGLAWTMRAAAADLLPVTPEATDPAQALMDMIGSWIRRAGRQYAIRDNAELPSWVGVFTADLRSSLVEFFEETQPEQQDPFYLADTAILALKRGLLHDDHEGSTHVDNARMILETLFPETENPPTPSGGGCATGEGSEGGESGESGESREGSEGSESSEGSEDSARLLQSILAHSANAEESADEGEPKTTEAEATARVGGTEKSEKPSRTSRTGWAGGDGMGGRWRNPTKDERAYQKSAEKFLRGMIDPGVASKVSISDSPSATVDPAALAAWKAGGKIKSPNFFRRTTRIEKPTPPVKVAILVDVSSSMDIMQAPSAVLSWALSSAALDLRNFAGRGSQVESCLIHWGSTSQVIQAPGAVLPGIREVNCNQGTHVMHQALAQVEEQMPGFFDPSEENRLLVQFTDWELHPDSVAAAQEWLTKALTSGVRMLSVVPSGGFYYSYHDRMVAATGKPSQATTMRYSPQDPGGVWAQASEVLKR